MYFANSSSFVPIHLFVFRRSVQLSARIILPSFHTTAKSKWSQKLNSSHVIIGYAQAEILAHNVYHGKFSPDVLLTS